MTQMTTRIGPYDIDMKTGDSRGRGQQCEIRRGPYCCTLEHLLRFGNIPHTGNGGTKADFEVPPPGRIGEIENWAYNNGYM